MGSDVEGDSKSHQPSCDGSDGVIGIDLEPQCAIGSQRVYSELTLLNSDRHCVHGSPSLIVAGSAFGIRLGGEQRAKAQISMFSETGRILLVCLKTAVHGVHYYILAYTRLVVG